MTPRCNKGPSQVPITKTASNSNAERFLRMTGDGDSIRKTSAVKRVLGRNRHWRLIRERKVPTLSGNYDP